MKFDWRVLILIYIKKGDEPQKLREWKEENKDLDCCYKNLTSECKAAIQLSLLKEQGYICCFCGCRIASCKDGRELCIFQRPSSDFGRIAHLVPQSKDKSKDVDYLNMCYSCAASYESPRVENEHCDRWQGNKELYITPLDKECSTAFIFDEDGKIKSAEENELYEKTIQNLNLNCTRLVNKRKAVIAYLKKIIEKNKEKPEFHNDEKRVRTFLFRKISQKTQEGKYLNFFFVMLSFLDGNKWYESFENLQN